MGAPEVIAVPSKSYVAINSYKCDKSISPTLCDLGRVSNIAAVVTLPRTSNFVNRNSDSQSVRSLIYKKRPFSETLNYSNSNSFHENMPTAKSETITSASHKKRRYASECQTSTSALKTQSAIETDSEINSISIPQNSQGILSSHLSSSLSTNSSFQQSDQICSRETEGYSHLQVNQHERLHGSNTTHLSNQHTLQQPTVVGQLTTYNSLTMKLLHQNQQLRNENVQLQKQLSLFRQLIKNPQRLNQVIARLEQRAQ